LAIAINGHLAFDALRMRLHPAASRIRKLSGETPARFVAFDILAEPGGKVLIDEPLSVRRQSLEHLVGTVKPLSSIQLSPMIRERVQAARWLEQSGPNGTDGVVAKRLDAHYAPGERAMIKVKRLRTADCVVGGFRYESGSDEVGSLLLGLYDEDGKLDHVGFTSTITDDERAELTKRLESLREPPGFTGKAPGGPSRWSTERSGEWSRCRRS
jgi:ATP-dependent DNA ligase